MRIYFLERYLMIIDAGLLGQANLIIMMQEITPRQ